jgi:hypothetical protein
VGYTAQSKEERETDRRGEKEERKKTEEKENA